MAAAATPAIHATAAATMVVATRQWTAITASLDATHPECRPAGVLTAIAVHASAMAVEDVAAVASAVVATAAAMMSLCSLTQWTPARVLPVATGGMVSR